MSRQRDANMIRALHTLMGEMGDMPIPISALWLERIVNRAGVTMEIYDHTDDREVDAVALGALCAIALRECKGTHP